MNGSMFGGGIVMLLLFVGALVLLIASTWIIFAKAKRPGWAAIVPVYNAMVMAEIAGRPQWQGVFLLIPLVNLVYAFLIWIDIAKAFGKSTGYGVGLVLLSPVFVPMLAFGQNTYTEPEPHA